MILFPNSKINLGLRITGKRTDGYHDIETVFYPIDLRDAAELTRAGKDARQEFELIITGLNVPGETTGNLCHKAWGLIKKDFPEIGPLRLHLLKAIPVGAGLGGGSSDGAHTLLLMNQELGLNLTDEKLIAYALNLGSDCPFFILNKPCLAEGRGEKMKELQVDLSDHYFVLVDPEVHISSAWAFERIILNKTIPREPLSEIITRPVEAWKHNLINEFEAPVFAEYETLKIIKEELYAAGASYASLTGTGSCVYGIFPRHSCADLRTLADQYKMYNLKQNR